MVQQEGLRTISENLHISTNSSNSRVEYVVKYKVGYIRSGFVM